MTQNFTFDIKKLLSRMHSIINLCIFDIYKYMNDIYNVNILINKIYLLFLEFFLHQSLHQFLKISKKILKTVVFCFN